MAVERKVRRTQAITPSGVGAIIDVLGESFVAEDVSRWRGRRHVLRGSQRIAARLGVDELRTPPAMESLGDGLPFYRFPEWLFCGRCRAMSRWHPRKETPGQPPRCDRCQHRPPRLVPMRFIAVCGNGHLCDVDWRRWAHSGPGRSREQRQCGVVDLQFCHVPGVGGGLESLQIRCATCESARDLSELTQINSLSRIGVRCPGRQPWQRNSEAQECDQDLVVVQRGASNVYFPEIVSAIDLPPDSAWASWGGPEGRIEHNENFKILLSKPEHQLADQLISLIASEEHVTDGQVRQVLAQKLGRPAAPAPSGGVADLPREEWQALTNPAETFDPRDNFIARRTAFPSPAGHRSLEPVADALAGIIADVILVDRLREIRVLRGFRRHTMNRMVPADLGRAGFLPAVEIFGEGVFIRFNEERIADWAETLEVMQRCGVLRSRLAASFRSRLIEHDLSPRLVLLHTFAHLLMRQLAFSAGYSSSSLRERLYCAGSSDGAPMAGVLIYTAAGDSEGTLGGLVRLGEADRLVPAIAAALATAQWCSLDPVCRESTAQGPDGLSLAACHACALASETSCVMGNVLLDRLMVVDEEFGFLREPLAALLQTRALT